MYLDVWVGTMGDISELDTAVDEELYIPRAGTRCFSTGVDYLDRTGEIYFEVLAGGSIRVFVLGSETEPISLLLCPVPYTFLHYPPDELKKLAELLRLKDLQIKALFVIVEYWYLQHRKCDWHGSQGLLYHTNLIPASSILVFVVTFSYGTSFTALKGGEVNSEIEGGTECRWNEQRPYIRQG